MSASKKTAGAGKRFVHVQEENTTLVHTAIPKSLKPAHGTGLQKDFGSIPVYPGVQTKLSVNTPGDQYEREADNTAEKIMSVDENNATGISKDISPLVQTKDGNGSAVSDLMNEKISGSRGKGVSLDSQIGSLMSGKFGVDFGSVKIHADEEAASMNKEINARAFTVGNDIYFNKGEYKPATQSGKKLLAHELTHTVQQRKSAGSIQCTAPADVSGEMMGMKFTLLADQTATDGKTTVPKGTTVEIVSWSSTDHFVTATATIAKKRLTVKPDKQHLKPVGSAGSGLKQYSMGVAGSQAAVKSGDQKITAHKGKEEAYKKAKNMAGFTAELTRLEDLQENRYETLNSNLIQETMVNRFDAAIVKWVAHYNKSLKPAKALDPNIVKSILYQETKMGTRGQHLEPAPYGWSGKTSFPIKSIYNLGQSIDSWGPQQYLMIKEMAPAVYSKYGLNALEKGLAWKGMTNDDYEAWNGGDFIKAMKEYNAERSGGKNLNKSSGKDLMLDYDYWIRTAVRWLFTKYFSLKKPSWPEAVKAYNGSGSDAEQYKKDVLSRI